MNRKTIFIFSATIFIFGGFIKANAQCGADGIQPCLTKPVRPQAKIVVKKTVPVKKAVASETGKKQTPKKPAQTKTKNTSIYDSLKVDANAKPASDENILFPINGVTIGKTTEAQMKILGGKRETFNDASTGTERVYYTINDMNFWLRDGVADSVGIYKFIDKFPTKWELLGFNFQLSYKESIKLLEDLGYEVQATVNLPKLEEIGKKNTTARITATKNGEISTTIAMSFLFDNGKNSGSPETLLFMFAGVKH